ncbi:MAG TPA: hydrogenase expression/formation protein HypE, partial [Anaerolineaceae bacterium]|nr:hydrogenase expression/formation protein HypE [Anaerolineaceae bacterium]
MKPEEKIPPLEGPVCALPLRHSEQIVMGHGSGGRMTRDLIEKTFKPFLSSPALAAGNDFARVAANGSGESGGRLAVSTDS